MYPTLAKLVAATCFAGLAAAVSVLVAGNLPDHVDVLWMAMWNAALGLVLGWRVLGQRAGRGLADSIGIGVTTGALVLFWAIFVWAGYRMLDRARALRYDDLFEGIEGWIELMFDTARLTWPGPALFVLAAGSAAIGALVEGVARRERS